MSSTVINITDNDILSIGVDLGGTNTSIGIVDNQGNIISKKTISSLTESPTQWRDGVIEVIENLITEHGAGRRISGIGIGAPCANAITGTIEAATDLPWPSPIPLVKLFKEKTELPVIVTNDANAAAIGEMIYGVAKGYNNFIVLTLGTGVGAGVVCDGHLLSGSRGFAGELGHVTFPFAKGRMCGCGRDGCLQTVASAKGIVETAMRFLKDKDEPSSLRDIPENNLTAKTIAEEAEKGDRLAEEIFKFTGECLGKAAAEFAALTDPQAIILFGGVANAGDLLLKPMIKAFKENSLHLYKNEVSFFISNIPESQAAVLGAASLPFLGSHTTSKNINR